MGIPFSIPCDPCVNKISLWLDEKVGYIHNLEKNLETLKKTMEDLTVKQEDLSRRLKIEEDRGLQRLAEFNLWLTRVESKKKKVHGLLSDRDDELQKLCLCGVCSKNLISSYRYGKNVFSMIREVEELKIQVFDKIVDKTSVAQETPLQPIKKVGKIKSEILEVIDEQAQSSEVEERQLQHIIVGQETMLEKAWNHLMEDGVGMMGMYGMGGVGKTTILSQINNKFIEDKCGFDFVIWVVVSKELHVEKILNEIAQKVGLGGEELNQKDRSQKADRLFNFLKKKRFVLFLDDIWEKVDLAEIGVPDPRTQIGCKVAFTTRSQEVCARMGVEGPMEVQCLTENEAFDLFQKKVGQVTLGSDPGIPDLARMVAKKCCGLPLALNVIGETMSYKRTIQEWRYAIKVLNSYAREFSGMDDKILPLLKYSYDSLTGEEVKSCLLYCALFPEDDTIPKEKLTEYWICEGIVDGSEGIENAENKGYDIIGSLVCASLLMDSGDFVRMHDVVREMALWIASDLGKQKEAFIVCAGVGISEIPKVKNWNVVRRMSLMKNKIHHLAGSPEYLELTTLLLQNGEMHSRNLSNISSEFFKSMPKLAVLDLSDNQSLYELPEEISKLVSLQYLNLARTGIRHLPKGLQELRKLIHLDLEETYGLRSIAGISSLQNLKVLKLFGSGFKWDLNIVDDLEALEHLEILTINFNQVDELEQYLSSHRLMSCTQSRHKFLSSQRLMSCTQSLEILNLKSSGISLPETMDKLRKLIIHQQCSISEIKMGRICSFLSLSDVHIGFCKGLRELTFLMFAPNLRSLRVESVNQLEDIINKEKACEVENSGILPFPKLNDLRLLNLPKLKNIYWSPLPFPCLETILVKECPNLKKLPLDSKSCKQSENGLIIRYNKKEWIKGVEWEDKATKTRFLSSCQWID